MRCAKRPAATKPRRPVRRGYASGGMIGGADFDDMARKMGIGRATAFQQQQQQLLQGMTPEQQAAHAQSVQGSGFDYDAIAKKAGHTKATELLLGQQKLSAGLDVPSGPTAPVQPQQQLPNAAPIQAPSAMPATPSAATPLAATTVPTVGIDFDSNPNWGTGASGVGDISLSSLSSGPIGQEPMAQSNYQAGGSVADYRPGGTVGGGPPGVDTVPANLDNGEYVLPPETSQAMGGKQALDQAVMSTTGVPPVGAGVDGLQAGAPAAPQQPTRFETLVQAMTGKPPPGPAPEMPAAQGYAQGGMKLPDDEQTPSAARLHGLRLSGDQAQMLAAQAKGLPGVEQLQPAGLVGGPIANYRTRTDYNRSQRGRDASGGAEPTAPPQGNSPATRQPLSKPPEKPGSKVAKPPENKPAKPPEQPINPEWEAIESSVNAMDPADDTTPGLPNGYKRNNTVDQEGNVVGTRYSGPAGTMTSEGRGGTGRSTMFDKETMDAANASMRAGGGGGSFSSVGGAPHGVSDEDYAKMSPGEKSAAKVASMERATQSIRDLRNARRFAEGSKPVGGWDAYNAEQGQRAAQAQAETAQAQARQAFNQDLFKEAYGGKVDAAGKVAVANAKRDAEQQDRVDKWINQYMPMREDMKGNKDPTQQVAAKSMLGMLGSQYGLDPMALLPLVAQATSGIRSDAELLKIPDIANIKDPALQLQTIENYKADDQKVAQDSFLRLWEARQASGPPAPPAR